MRSLVVIRSRSILFSLDAGWFLWVQIVEGRTGVGPLLYRTVLRWNKCFWISLEFIIAVCGVLEAKEVSSGQKTAATDAALENFKQRWELFRVACDQAEEFVESMKQRIGSECLVDEATGSVVGKTRQTVSSMSLPPISAVRLEQMSKAVQWLVIELQHGSGTGASSSHSH